MFPLDIYIQKLDITISISRYNPKGQIKLKHALFHHYFLSNFPQLNKTKKKLKTHKWEMNKAKIKKICLQAKPNHMTIMSHWLQLQTTRRKQLMTNKNIISYLFLDRMQKPQQMSHPSSEIYTNKVRFFFSSLSMRGHVSPQLYYNKVVPKGFVVWGWVVLLTGNWPNPESINGFGGAIIRFCGACGGPYGVGGWYGPKGLAWYGDGIGIWLWTGWPGIANGSAASNGLGAGDPYTGCWAALYAPSSYKLLSVSESNPPACQHKFIKI